VIRGKYTSDPTFTPENAKKASAAAEGLCKWVHAMDKYETVAKVVAPKQAKLAIAEAAYEGVMVGLRALQADLKVLTDKLAFMEAELSENTSVHPFMCSLVHNEALHQGTQSRYCSRDREASTE
jgi:dynein heavy chain, axonemal